MNRKRIMKEKRQKSLQILIFTIIVIIFKYKYNNLNFNISQYQAVEFISYTLPITLAKMLLIVNFIKLIELNLKQSKSYSL